VGTGNFPRSEFKGKSDSTPEYVADEVLVITNTPEDVELSERREAGRFGRYGWTQKEGMPVWEIGAD